VTLTGDAAEDVGRMGERVHRVLRDRILDGHLPAGARLSVPALARELGVSRTPVRDAVMQLVREGLGEEVLNRGAVVRRPTRAELVSLYQAREALEGLTARLATAHFDPALRRRLKDLLDEHERAVAADDFSRHIEVDSAFHREIRLAARSPVVATMLSQIQGQVVVAMRSTSASGGMAQALEDHRRIFRALAAGDPDQSERVARAHIGRLTELLRSRA